MALQLDALRAAGCDRIFEDRASGAKTDRPGLTEALAYVREGDVLIIWKLVRLARSLPHLIETMSQLEKNGAGLQSLTEAIDTTTPGGRLCQQPSWKGLLQSRCKLWKKGEPNCPKLLGVQTFSVAASMTLYSAPPPDRILTRSPHVTACRGRDVAPRLKKTRIMREIPRLLADVISVTWEIWPRWRSRGLARLDATVSGLAPGSCA